VNNANYKTSLLLAALLLFALPVQATTWDFAPGGSSVQPVGSGFDNELRFLQDDSLLIATGWFESAKKLSNAKLRSANVSQFDGGLGLCNRREGNNCYGDGTDQPIDNAGQREWLLLQLEGDWSFESLTVSLVDNQSPLALSYFIGTVESPASLNGVRYEELAGLGFGPRVDVTLAAGDMANLALDSVLGNALLIGGGWDRDSDAFFASSLSAQPTVVPLPPAVWMFGSALGLLACLRRSLSLPVPKGQEWAG